MNPFKKGDIVICLRNVHNFCKKGKIYSVQSVQYNFTRIKYDGNRIDGFDYRLFKLVKYYPNTKIFRELYQGTEKGNLLEVIS